MTNRNLTHEELQALVGRAIVDQVFQRDLLNGRREACLSEFDLSRDALHAARAIKAHDLSSFAKQLDGWIHDQAPRGNVASAVASTRQATILSAVA